MVPLVRQLGDVHHSRGRLPVRMERLSAWVRTETRQRITGGLAHVHGRWLRSKPRLSPDHS